MRMADTLSKLTVRPQNTAMLQLQKPEMLKATRLIFTATTLLFSPQTKQLLLFQI